MINFDKFLASFITEMKKYQPITCYNLPACIKKALEDQGLEYKDGEIVKTQDIITVESEDEKIRKRIIQAIKIREKEMNEEWSDEIAWLEKQGVQKSADKVEPKFKVGDTIRCKYDDREFTIKTVDLEGGFYTYTQEGCGNDIDYADDVFELVEKPTDYEWDGEKKELKKIEHKFAWSEEDEKMHDFAIRAIGLCKQYAINHQVNGYSNLPDVPKKYEELQDWLKSLKDRVGCETNCTTTKEWSKEDEKTINDIMWIIEAYRKNGFNETHIQMADNSEKWLKSIEERVQLQSNPEWSEEDEKECKRVVGLLEGWLSTFEGTCYAEDCKCGISWLNSLKQRMKGE